MEEEIISVCGLLCSSCDIMEATTKKEVAQRIVDWFRKEQDQEVNIEDIKCDGCRGDRTMHWSPDCWILKCCVDDRGLDYCNECADFPCQKLIDWSKESKGYAHALERLKELKRNPS